MRPLLVAIAALTLIAAPVLYGAGNYFIQGATVHTLEGEPIERGSVLLQNGLIAGVGRNLRAPRGAKVIDARGLHVYPGLFDAFSQLGLVEISAVGATRDVAEKGDFNPQLQALIAVHPESEHIPVARANGITHALTAMEGGVIAGQAGLIHLDGWTYEEMALDPEGPLVVRWPVIRVYPEHPGPSKTPDEEEERPATWEKAQKKNRKQVAEIGSWFESAHHYAQARKNGLSPQRRDRKLEALVPFVEGRRRLLVVAHRARTIRNVVAFAAKHELKIILVGGTEAWRVKDLLKNQQIPVILGPTQMLPLNEDEHYDVIFTQPSQLHQAGVRFAFGSGTASRSRRLPYQAAGAVPFGLPKQEALKAVTRYPAEILGVGDKLGTIEEGKIANLIVTNGDPLEITTVGVCTSLPTTPHLVVGRSACRVGVGPSLNRSWAQRSRPVVQAGRRAFPGDESVVD